MSLPQSISENVIQTDTYYIINSYSGNCAASTRVQDGSWITASTDFMHPDDCLQWKVYRHMNGRYRLENIHTKLAAAPHGSTSEDDAIIGRSSSAHQWVVQESRQRNLYTIETVDRRKMWGLDEFTINYPVTLYDHATSRKTLWEFRPVVPPSIPTMLTIDLTPILLALVQHGDTASLGQNYLLTGHVSPRQHGSSLSPLQFGVTLPNTAAEQPGVEVLVKSDALPCFKRKGLRVSVDTASDSATLIGDETKPPPSQFIRPSPEPPASSVYSDSHQSSEVTAEDLIALFDYDDLTDDIPLHHVPDFYVNSQRTYHMGCSSKGADITEPELASSARSRPFQMPRPALKEMTNLGDYTEGNPTSGRCNSPQSTQWEEQKCRPQNVNGSDQMIGMQAREYVSPKPVYGSFDSERSSKDKEPPGDNGEPRFQRPRKPSLRTRGPFPQWAPCSVERSFSKPQDAFQHQKLISPLTESYEAQNYILETKDDIHLEDNFRGRSHTPLGTSHSATAPRSKSLANMPLHEDDLDAYRNEWSDYGLFKPLEGIAVMKKNQEISAVSIPDTRGAWEREDEFLSPLL